MNDLISRRAALNALGERPTVWTDDDDYALGERNQYDMDRLAIETVPSAQLVNIAKLQPNCNQVASDCISRAAAVEAMRKAKDKSEAHRILMQLPSAQKYGTWIVSHFGANAKCSECGMYCVGAYDHDRCDQYCRCCGAKMDGLKLEGGEP